MRFFNTKEHHPGSVESAMGNSTTGGRNKEYNATTTDGNYTHIQRSKSVR